MYLVGVFDGYGEWVQWVGDKVCPDVWSFIGGPWWLSLMSSCVNVFELWYFCVLAVGLSRGVGISAPRAAAVGGSYWVGSTLMRVELVLGGLLASHWV
ncbi:MAG TPA: hypothetical protein P5300_00365 [Acidobacteriota bacterium]|nr:hypothetical protein [Acidobacteriota bacterium]